MEPGGRDVVQPVQVLGQLAGDCDAVLEAVDLGGGEAVIRGALAEHADPGREAREADRSVKAVDDHAQHGRRARAEDARDVVAPQAGEQVDGGAAARREGDRPGAHPGQPRDGDEPAAELPSGEVQDGDAVPGGEQRRAERHQLPRPAVPTGGLLPQAREDLHPVGLG
ncbi:hypothetical protein GCM10022247_50670 [Allokutzneria multivorans]|uniref:Uncharacterized protein n=1 Tax=Allokutzneria multivorans TaxID=1142134 RepID=A0ABP7T3E7_9PSEU